ncbi:aromatic amino acid lyase [Aestuariicella hydrocarbonica]|uniref:tyrosine ammonia-lyase n=1 Tax=Pseudomaricurvus hydrocarbonicus TaxID=1470433 RepID=A0A9E5JQM3_9GAMM|nr:aromatic amino acid ammonia-lyase [Aestuariicella hydrocarbonica]NHO64902.1 aromatic amino acid lyase [Aestuariicella hydrocarbonica]
MITFDSTPLTIEDIVAIALQQQPVQLSQAAEFQQRIAEGSDFLDKLLVEDGEIYGVTTGYGDSCTVTIPSHLVPDLPKHLYTFHGCGLGAMLSPTMVRAVLAARLSSLCQGFSGVSPQLLLQFERLLQHDIMPVIPEEGSVGASGDLTPLSYVAAVLCGEREVYYQGDIRPTAEVFLELGIDPITLRPKEGLAIMNGTAVMTGLACMAYARAQYLSKLTTRITAMCSLAIKGNAHHFDELLFSVKPHPGQQRVAAWLRQDLHVGEPPRNSRRLQDRYSLRCAPHVIGVQEDALPWLRQLIENELNSSNDNPIIDGSGEHVLHGGHFYGGHIALAMDTLKNTVANLADLLDRQMAQMMDTKFNHGLPANLSGAQGERQAINHGFKAVQIGTSAWTAEALKQTMPASVFSRSTECHNQDKVSMGTIAARDCLRVLQLTEQVASAALLASCQGVELRIRQRELSAETLSPAIADIIDQVRSYSPFLEEDRALDAELRHTVTAIQTETWPLYGAQ